MTIDSPAAFEIAQQFAEANGKNLGTVSYVLQQTGGGLGSRLASLVLRSRRPILRIPPDRRHQRHRHIHRRLAARAVESSESS